jgi:hypothetical protein
MLNSKVIENHKINQSNVNKNIFYNNVICETRINNELLLHKYLILGQTFDKHASSWRNA